MTSAPAGKGNHRSGAVVRVRKQETALIRNEVINRELVRRKPRCAFMRTKVAAVMLRLLTNLQNNAQSDANSARSRAGSPVRSAACTYLSFSISNPIHLYEAIWLSCQYSSTLRAMASPCHGMPCRMAMHFLT